MLCILLSAMLAACIKDDVPDVVERVRVGDSLPQMQVEMSNGIVLSNADFEGKTVVLVFFSTLCGDCRKELPEVQKLWEACLGRPDVMVLGISRGEGEEMVSTYWKEMDLSFPYSAQDDRHIYELFANSIVPRIYVANGQGKVIAAYNHDNMPSWEELMRVVSQNSI